MSDDEYNFDSVNTGQSAGRPSAVPSSSSGKKYRAAATAVTMKQTIGTVGIVRRSEEASAALEAELAAEAAAADASAEDEYADAGFEEDDEAAAPSDQSAAAASASTPAQATAAAAPMATGGSGGDESAQLRARLVEARTRTPAMEQRARDAVDAYAREQTERTETRRKLDSAYDRLSAILEGSPGMQVSMAVDDDLDVLAAREHISMLRQRLAAAREVLRRHTDEGQAMRQVRRHRPTSPTFHGPVSPSLTIFSHQLLTRTSQRRELYERNHGVSQPSAAPPRGHASRPRAGGPTWTGGDRRGGVVTQTEEERKVSVARLYDDSMRKKVRALPISPPSLPRPSMAFSDLAKCDVCRCGGRRRARRRQGRGLRGKLMGCRRRGSASARTSSGWSYSASRVTPCAGGTLVADLTSPLITRTRTRRVLSTTHVVVLLCRGPPCCVLACRSANEEKARKALEDDAATAAAKTSKDKRSGWATVERLFGEGKVCS